MNEYHKFLKTFNSGTQLWNYSKTIIPGGGQLLSKKAERFAPDIWPSYFKKANGYSVWDIKGKKYVDFAQMGVGSCVLGYANSFVNKEVRKAIRNGNMSSLNSFEEVMLAEKLLQLHPWAEMARFARTGGEACAIAARIARAASEKDLIAFCGYHGWHDWYISTNLSSDKHLDGQLLPGLTPNGVPRSLTNTTVTFNYNDVNSVKNLENYGDKLGVIYMESVRGVPPTAEFIDAINTVARKYNAVIVVDEVTAGFRENLGGWHLKTDLNADIAVFGKALGNGYPISAIIGKKSVMEAATKSFISSTMWTERIGFVAALATINQFERKDVINRLISNGKRIKQIYHDNAKKFGIALSISGIDPLPSFKFLDGHENVYQTYVAQEMLKKGYLVGSSIYSSSIYDNKILDKFNSEISEVFEKLKRLNPMENDLEGGVIMTSFARLNG